MLNAEMKARCFAMSLFIGTSGSAFDIKRFESNSLDFGSTVAWPLGLGVQRDEQSNVDRILAPALVQTMGRKVGHESKMGL